MWSLVSLLVAQRQHYQVLNPELRLLCWDYTEDRLILNHIFCFLCWQNDRSSTLFWRKFVYTSNARILCFGHGREGACLLHPQQSSSSHSLVNKRSQQSEMCFRVAEVLVAGSQQAGKNETSHMTWKQNLCALPVKQGHWALVSTCSASYLKFPARFLLLAGIFFHLSKFLWKVTGDRPLS